MNVENENINELDDYNRIRLIDNFEQRLQCLRKVLQIDWDLLRKIEISKQPFGTMELKSLTKCLNNIFLLHIS